MLKVLFMGTPDFAANSLKAIHEANFEILGVVTNIDKQKGRGMKTCFSPVKEYAIENNFKIYQPEKIKNNTEFIENIKELKPDVICVVAYGKILPKQILDIPKFGCINVHASLLPKYRGAAPIQWAIINGEKTTGITTMYMDIGMDTGDIILKQEMQIGEEETTGELWDRLSILGGELLVKTLKQIETGNITRKKQPDEFTLAPMLDKQMSKIDWENKTAKQIKDLTRGLNPIMGTYSCNKEKKYKFWKLKDISIENLLQKFDELKSFKDKITNMNPGTVIISDTKKGMYIKAKDEIIQVIEIQAPNAKKMNVCDFLRGNKIDVGSKFE